MHLCTVLVRILMQEDKRIVGCHSESFMIDWLFKFVLNLKSRSLSVLSRLFNRMTYKGILAFEDNWPSKGDYDLNDVIVKYSSILSSIPRIRCFPLKIRLRQCGLLQVFV